MLVYHKVETHVTSLVWVLIKVPGNASAIYLRVTLELMFKFRHCLCSFVGTRSKKKSKYWNLIINLGLF